jgi:hypothetical protein
MVSTGMDIVMTLEEVILTPTEAMTQVTTDKLMVKM